MDLSRVYRNRGLEEKRKNLIARNAADAALRRGKSRDGNVRCEIDRALAGEACGWLSTALRPVLRGTNDAGRARLAGFFRTLADAHSRLLDDRAYVRPLTLMARALPHAVRPLEDWRPSTYNAARQFASLLRHLFTWYDVPAWFDSAWTGDSADHRRWRDWYLRVGNGENLRKMNGLPMPMTKAMAHAAMTAPATVTVPQALRYGQVRGLGGSHALARAIVGSRVGGATTDEPFWLTVIHGLVNSPMLDPFQVGPIVDYVHDRKFVPQPPTLVDGRVVAGEIAEPNFSMKGRTAASLLRQTLAWHGALARLPRRAAHFTWSPCGVAGLRRIEGTGPDAKAYTIHELLSTVELYDEGSAMHHCVGSYAMSCRSGRAAIFAMRVRAAVGIERLLTLELRPAARSIVQARGKRNRRATSVEQRIVRAWAAQASLSVGDHVW
jgi:hypothetical protein